MTAPTMVNGNLADRAVLVNLSISQWSAAKSDKKVNREVAQQHGSDESMGNYRKSLIARDAIKKYTELASAIRQEHYKLTLPWRDSGDRILSSAGYFQYAEKMRKFELDLAAAWQEFIANYPQYIADARQRLNGLFNEEDYPNPSKIHRKFSFKLDVLPLPEASDFRVNLGDAEVQRLRNQIQADSDSQLQRAMQDVWIRMRDVVSKMADRLKLYSVNRDGSVSNPFRDSLVTNISDLLDLIPVLNLTGDQNVSEFAAAMRDDLTRYSPDQLRNAEYARKDTAARADEILAKMSAFIA